MQPRLTIGACYQAKHSRMEQYFSGHLAGLQFLRGRRQAGGAVQCMLQCAEQLQFNGLTQLVPKEVCTRTL